MAKNEVCHIEWEVTNMERSQRFYQEMFDWKFQPFGDQMTTFGSGDKHIGGLFKRDKVNPGTSPSIWIEADDIDHYIKRASQAGGSSGTEKQMVPSVGWTATIKDPDGNSVGLVQFVRAGV